MRKTRDYSRDIFTYVVKKFTIQDRDTCRWGGVSSEEKLFYFLFFFFATPKSHPQKTAARSKTFVVSVKGRQGKLEKKRERERNREKEIEKKRKRETDSETTIWGTIKKYPAICLLFPSLFFSFPFPLFSFFLSMSTSTRAFIHAKITKFRVKRARKYVSTAETRR